MRKIRHGREPRRKTYEVAIPLCPSDQFMLDTKQFYDDLSSYYHLIFEDWDASMARQGDALAQLIGSELTGNLVTDLRVLDVACGIGTQALPLAARGFPVTARDLSPAAVARLQQEAQVRELVVDTAVSDMRHVASSVTGLFDVVLAFDNSLTHLPDDSDLRAAFQQFLKVLRLSGVFLCSIRDYDTVKRGEPMTHLYGHREYRGEKFQLRQEWTWYDPMHYQGTIIIDKETPNGLAQKYAPRADSMLSRRNACLS